MAADSTHIKIPSFYILTVSGCSSVGRWNANLAVLGDNRKRKRKCPAAGDAVNDLKDDGESSLSVHRWGGDDVKRKAERDVVVLLCQCEDVLFSSDLELSLFGVNLPFRSDTVVLQSLAAPCGRSRYWSKTSPKNILPEIKPRQKSRLKETSQLIYHEFLFPGHIFVKLSSSWLHLNVKSRAGRRGRDQTPQWASEPEHQPGSLKTFLLCVIFSPALSF